jgi:RNA polymerase sigma-70 factor (ECF subfamily)
MDTTPVSLLEQLRQPADEAAWRRFVHLYTPLLYSWARRVNLQDQDASDLVQDVLIVLVRKLPEFQYDKRKKFRAWLRTVLLNKWRDSRKKSALRAKRAEEAGFPELADPYQTDGLEEAEYRQYLASRALRLMQAEFETSTWKAFWEYLVEGRPAAEVARRLGITVNAVYLAKCRVLRRLREELAGLLD